MSRASTEETRTALEFLRDMAARYATVYHPDVVEHDWRWRAQRTVADLAGSPKATRIEYGDRYAMPYVAGQYPDSMVQLNLLTALHAYAKWRGDALPLERELRAGVERFYDPEVRTLRRYLPSVGEEKDYDAVDSWYLYHPMMNLARLAADGDMAARDLLLRCADYGICAAHHFDYSWPVFYKIQDYSVITRQADAARPGETDAGGLYAYVMLQLHALTGQDTYLQEARAALEAADGRGFELMYQANLTAWGVVAAFEVWRRTGDEGFRERTYYWLANLLRWCSLADSQAGFAVHYPTFFGLPCMYNSAYMAPLEDTECYLALGELVHISGDALDPSVAVLANGFRRHVRHRAWYFYPDQLPPEIIASKQESGEIDRSLSFPLEDLYADGSAPGQIGQEIYGAGCALFYAMGDPKASPGG
jgi:hypothetical protein